MGNYGISINLHALLAALETVCRSLGDSGVHPAHASSLDVARVLGCGVAEVEDAAVGLAAKGLLRIGRTLNYDYYEINNNNE